MNIVVAMVIALGWPAVEDCGVVSPIHALRAARWAADRVTVPNVIDSVCAAAANAGDDVIYAAKGSKGKKKQKAVNPWPMSGKADDPLSELIMLGIGLVVLLILAGISYSNGR